MTMTVKIQRKGQMTLPTRLRALAGIAEGDSVEAAFQRGKIMITSKLLIDRSQFPSADGDYTPAQRRVIDARLTDADADIKAGRVSRAFENHEEFFTDLHKEARKLIAKRFVR